MPVVLRGAISRPWESQLLDDHWHHELRALALYIAHRAVDHVPFERIGSESERSNQLFCLLCFHCRIEPYCRVFGGQHDRASVVDVDHAALSVGCDYRKTVGSLDFGVGAEVGQRRQVERLAVAAVDMPGLLLIFFAGPFIIKYS